MELLAFVERNWTALAAAPLAFVGALLIGGTLGYWLARSHYVSLADARTALVDATRERLVAAQEDLARARTQETESRQEIGYLVGRLTTHGEELQAIQQQLKTLPNIIVSDRPPSPDDKAPEGTLWFNTSP